MPDQNVNRTLDPSAGEESIESLVPHLIATASIDWKHHHSVTRRSLQKPSTHEDFLREWDFSAHDDPLRNSRYLMALRLSRKYKNTAIDWSFLVRLQTIVLGHNAIFRKGSAYSHMGKRRYAFSQKLPEFFAKKITSDFKNDTAPLAKAVRLYLDIIFIHPFNDGNARAARLAFEHTLNYFQHPLPSMDTLVHFPKEPGNAASYVDLLNELEHSL